MVWSLHFTYEEPSRRMSSLQVDIFVQGLLSVHQKLRLQQMDPSWPRLSQDSLRFEVMFPLSDDTSDTSCYHASTKLNGSRCRNKGPVNFLVTSNCSAVVRRLDLAFAIKLNKNWFCVSRVLETLRPTRSLTFSVYFWSAGRKCSGKCQKNVRTQQGWVPRNGPGLE